MLLIGRGGLKKKRVGERLGFDLVLRASFHLTVPIQESSPKLDSRQCKAVPIAVSQTVSGTLLIRRCIFQ